MPFQIRKARLDDRPAIESLIAASARELSQGFYNDTEIEAALASVFGVDTTLIEDGTYFVVETEGAMAGCGGWSRRKTLFGGDRFAARDAGVLNPARDAARIRAFFVAPQYARRGIARMILQRCEIEAKKEGFLSAELMSTLPGVPFYAACGYEAQSPVTHPTPSGVILKFVPMCRKL